MMASAEIIDPPVEKKDQANSTTNHEIESVPEGWKSLSLGQLLKKVDVRGSSLLPGDELEVLSLTKNNGLILQSARFERRIAIEDTSKYKVIRKGQIAYNPYVIWEGAVHGLRKHSGGLVSPVYSVWETLEPDDGFIDFLLRTPKLIDHYNRLCSGAVNRRRSIGEEDFLSIVIPIPTLQERRTIAGILNTVQEAKETSKRLLSSMLQLKLSLRQHLFSFGATPFDAIDQVDLQETSLGPIPAHWQLVKLKDLLKQKVRNGHSAKPTNTNTGVRTLTLTAVTQHNFCLKNTKLTCADPNRVTDLWLKPGDILVERANTPEYVGLAALYEGEEHWAIFPDLMVRVRIDETRCVPKFAAEFLLSSASRRYYQKNTKKTSGNFPKIDQGIIENTLLPLAPIDEQNAIAKCLRTVDTKIAMERARISALEKFELSISDSLMTGKVRVNRSSLDSPTENTSNGGE